MLITGESLLLHLFPEGYRSVAGNVDFQPTGRVVISECLIYHPKLFVNFGAAVVGVSQFRVKFD